MSTQATGDAGSVKIPPATQPAVVIAQWSIDSVNASGTPREAEVHKFSLKTFALAAAALENLKQPAPAPISATHQAILRAGIKPEGKAGRTLNKVERFVLFWLYQICLFGKDTNSLRIKEYYHARIREHNAHVIYIEQEIQRSLATKASTNVELLNYKPNPQNAGKLLPIPEGLLTDFSHLHGKVGSRDDVARRAAGAGIHKNIQDVHVDGVGTMKAYRLEGEGDNIKIVDNEVTPTSFRIGKKGAKDSLTNVYVIMVEGKEYGIIRSGVINTKQRADEFAGLLKKMRADIVEKTGNPKFKMRVLSHQLNSYENEGAKLIVPQHQWMAYVNKQMREKNRDVQMKDGDDEPCEVVHIDTSSNAWYTYASQHPKTLGRLMKGEQRTKEMNADTWGTYVKWAAEDMRPTAIIGKITQKKGDKESISQERRAAERLFIKEQGLVNLLSSFPSVLSGEMSRLKIANSLSTIAENQHEFQRLSQEINDKEKLLKQKEKQTFTRDENRVWQNEIITNLKKDIADSKADFKVKSKQLKQEIVEAGKTLKNARKEMQAILKKDYRHLDRLENELYKAKAAIPITKGGDHQSVYENWHYQPKILDDCLQKVILMKQILGSQLGMPGKVLDRGKEGMAIQLLNIKLGVTSALNCFSGIDRTGLWHAIRVAMEEMSVSEKVDPNALFTMINEWEETTKFMNEAGDRTIMEWVKPQPDDGAITIGVKDKMRNVIEFRKLVLKNLLTMGLDIQQISTLFAGAKFHIGTWQENTTPLNFFPPTVDVQGKETPLILYSDQGKPVGSTEFSKKLIERLATERQS